MAQKINHKQIQVAPAFAAPPYTAGWADYDSGTEWLGARYTKLSSGLVVMKGLARNTSGATKAAGSIICTLPAGYRPAHRLRFISSQAGAVASTVDVGASGGLILNVALAAGEWVSLANITFVAEQ